MNLNVLQQIPARIRATIYLSLAIVALILGALQVADVSSLWGFATVKALAVVGFLAAPFGITAAANVTTGTSSDSGGMGAGYHLPDVDVSDPVDEAGATTVHDIVVASAIGLLVLLLAIGFSLVLLG